MFSFNFVGCLDGVAAPISVTVEGRTLYKYNKFLIELTLNFFKDFALINFLCVCIF